MQAQLLRWPWNVSAGALQLGEEQLRVLLAPIVLLAGSGALLGHLVLLWLYPDRSVLLLALAGHVVLVLTSLRWLRVRPPENVHRAILLVYAYLALMICVPAALFQTPHTLLQFVPLNIASFYFLVNRPVLIRAQCTGAVLCTAAIVALWGHANLPQYLLAVVTAWVAGLAIHTGRVSILEALSGTREALRAEVDERRQAEARALVSKKRESLGVMASGIAHDFNNLMTTIVGGTELAATARGKRGVEGEALTIIREAADAARELCGSLMDYAGGSSGAQSRIDLNDVARDAVRLTRPRLPQQTALIAERAGEPVLVSGNAAELRQAVVNLILNAVDAFDGGPGIVRVITDLHEQQGQVLRRLRVLDNGPGIPEAVLERVFDPFFTTKPSGRGLGLARVAATLAAHRGQIDVESVAGGTVFELRLPPPEADVAMHAGSAPEALAESGHMSAAANSFARTIEESRQDTQLDMLFTSIFDQLPHLVMQKDRANTTLRVNKAMAALRGLTPEAMANSRTEQWHPDEASAYYLDDQEVIRTGQPKLGIREQIETAIDEKHWFVTDKVPTFDAEGNVSGVLVFSRRLDPPSAEALTAGQLASDRDAG